MDPQTNAIVPLFHPRRHAWSEHFCLDNSGRLRGLTPAGRVTVLVMDMNDPDRVTLRSLLVRIGRWPA